MDSFFILSINMYIIHISSIHNSNIIYMPTIRHDHDVHCFHGCPTPPKSNNIFCHLKYSRAYA